MTAVLLTALLLARTPSAADTASASAAPSAPAAAPAPVDAIQPADDSQQSVARAALSTARTALSKAGVPTLEINARLAEAESLFAAGRYTDAATAADLAWKKHAQARSHESAFEVTVLDDGATVVKHKKGKPVRVEGNDETTFVSAGELARLEPGKSPLVTSTAPASPKLLSPRNASKVELLGDPAALGPVVLTWSRVPGAKSYEVELASDDGKRRTVTVATTEAVFPKLPAGRYVWKVHAVGADGRTPSGERSFQLARRTMKLKVTGGTSFK